MTATPSIKRDAVQLSRTLGVFDATLIVMGAIIGSGIFVTPAVVARRLHDGRLIVAAWLFGGVVTLIGAFIFAELARRRPAGGGLYGYLRDAYGPFTGFAYGWTALLVTQSGGIAAAAITFGAYVAPLFAAPIPVQSCALAAIVGLTLVNCLGVRQGSNVQNALMLAKAAGIVALVVTAFAIDPRNARGEPHVDAAGLAPAAMLGAFGAAMIPVFFAYSGFQTAGLVDREVKNARRVLPPALVWGVGGVVAMYVGVTLAGLNVLGAGGLAASATPVPDIVRLAFGRAAQRIVAIAVAVSLLGFLSNQILASPRIYFAMAEDRVLFRKLAWLHPKSRVPVLAIVLQGVVASVIALSGRYEQILNYVTAISSAFLALGAGALLVFRKHGGREAGGGSGVPGHPVTTLLFLAVAAGMVLNTALASPRDTLAGFGLLLAAVPAYYLLRRYERVTTVRLRDDRKRDSPAGRLPH